jgi:hypothetical protein
VEESAALSREPCSLAGDADVLAGEGAGEEIQTTPALPVSFPLFVPSVGATSDGWWFSPSHVSHVVVDVDAGEPGAKDCLAEGVNLTEKAMPEAGPSEADVHAANA